MSQDRPWMSGKFIVNDRTPVSDVIAYFTEAERLDDYTSRIEQATHISSDPVQGGLADVFVATLPDGTKLAVKRFRSKAGGDRKELKRTARELKAWSKLQHDHILNLLGLAQFRGRVSIISLWMENGTVMQYTRENAGADRYMLCGELTSVVAYLHDMDVVHGDLKGANVLISSEGHVKLSDFGLTIAQDDVMHLSTTNAYGGTLRWMAPELLTKSSPRSLRTDVWALGMTILEIITGEHPYSEIRSEAKIEEEVAKNRKSPARPDDSLDRLEAGGILWRKLGQCWAYDPLNRISAKTLAAYLKPAQSENFTVDTQHKTPQEVLDFFTNRWGLVEWTSRLHTSPPRLIARGACGAVYFSDAGNSGKVAIKVAVKVIRTGNRTSEDNRAILLKNQARELDSWSTFNHENILEFLGVAIFHRQLAMVSRWMDNGDVRDFVQRHPEVDRYIFCKQLAVVIEYLHSIPVVHGDIKGPNLLVFEDHNAEDNSGGYQLKLTDFGTTVVREDIFDVAQTEDEHFGTIRWMAPETFGGKALIPQSDVWAMAMTMLEIVTGLVPYHGLSEAATISKILYKQELPQALKNTSIRSNWLWICLLRCWEWDPAKRLTAAQVNAMMAMLPPA